LLTLKTRFLGAVIVGQQRQYSRRERSTVNSRLLTTASHWPAPARTCGSSSAATLPAIPLELSDAVGAFRRQPAREGQSVIMREPISQSAFAEAAQAAQKLLAGREYPSPN